MTRIYTTSTESIELVSFGASYLYQQYEKIQSFLKNNYSGRYKNVLAKPVLLKGENKIDWYGNFNAPLSKLYDLPEETQRKFKIKYWNTHTELHEDVEKLRQSTDKQKREWGAMLSEVFNDDNNIILTDGENWCILWGWEFKSRLDNFLAPEFLKPEPIPAPVTEKQEIVLPDDEDYGIPPQLPPIYTPPIINETPPPNVPPSVTSGGRRFNFWYWLKRSLRNFIYRFWGLLLLILFVLLIICLTKKCSHNTCCDEKVMQEQLDSLERITNEHCSNH